MNMVQAPEVALPAPSPADIWQVNSVGRRRQNILDLAASIDQDSNLTSDFLADRGEVRANSGLMIRSGATRR